MAERCQKGFRYPLAWEEMRIGQEMYGLQYDGTGHIPWMWHAFLSNLANCIEMNDSLLRWL